MIYVKTNVAVVIVITLVTFQKNVKALSSEHREASVDRLFHVLDLWMAKTSEIWFDSSPMRYLPSRRWLRYLKLSDEFFGLVFQNVAKALFSSSSSLINSLVAFFWYQDH